MQNIIRLGSRSECPIMQGLGLFDARRRIRFVYSPRFMAAKGGMQKSFTALRLAFFQSKIQDVNGNESLRNCNLARLSYILSRCTPAHSSCMIDEIVKR